MPKKQVVRSNDNDINQSRLFHMRTTPFIPIKSKSLSNHEDDLIDETITDDSSFFDDDLKIDDDSDLSLNQVKKSKVDKGDEELLSSSDVPYSGKASLISCAINLCNTVVGAGKLLNSISRIVY